MIEIKEAIARIKEHIEIHFVKEPRAIYISEALYMAIDAMRKRIPQKTKKIPYMYGAENRCPACNHFVGWEHNIRIKFCDECGQALDWSEEWK